MAKKYDYAIDLNADTTHTRIIRMVGHNKTVLEFGCATGHMSRVLVEQFGCTVTGIELNPEAAEKARKACRQVIVGDADTLDYERGLGGEDFDVVIFADVLEHLKDPQSALRRVRDFIKPDGYVLASIPSIAHGAVVLERLEGNFNYQPLGLLDDTHLRFFAKKTIYDLVESSGYVIDQLERVNIEPGAMEFRTRTAEFPPELVKVSMQHAESTAYQFIIKAYPATESGRIGQLKQKIDTLEAALAGKDTHVANLRTAVSDRGARIQQVESALAEREAYIQQIHSGHGWRLLTMYFNIRDTLLPKGTKRRVLAKNILRTLLSPAEVLKRRRVDRLFLLEHPRRVLVVDDQIPAPDQDAGSVRMYAILKLLREMDYAVTFVSSSESRKRAYEGKLWQLGVPVLHGYSTAVAHLTQYGRQYKYVLLSRPEVAFRFLPAVRAYALNSTVIYDSVDLHWVRFHRLANLSGDPAMRDQADHFKRIERLNAVCADLVFAVTPEEKERLLAEAPEARVEVVPTIHTSRPPSDLGNQREGLMFIGGFEHVPNVDAVKWFVEDVFPLIQRQLAGIVFYVIGSKMPRQVEVLASPSVRILGYVPDPEPYFTSSRVFVAPLRYGAGMKGKIGQSMSHGLPVVTTSTGAEGFMLQDGENALIADGAEAFAQAVVRLYTDDLLWKKIAANCSEHVRQHFSEEAVRSRLATIFASVRGGDRAEISDEECTA